MWWFVSTRPVSERGDVILMTGTSNSSKALAKSQKPFYLKARSSHVALVHADFICIDAMPGALVTKVKPLTTLLCTCDYHALRTSAFAIERWWVAMH